MVLTSGLGWRWHKNWRQDEMYMSVWGQHNLDCSNKFYYQRNEINEEERSGPVACVGRIRNKDNLLTTKLEGRNTSETQMKMANRY
jgi:hypothetical protein